MSGEALRTAAEGKGPILCADRRVSARHPCSLEVKCQAIGGSTEGPWTGKIIDLSTTGLGLLLPEPLDRGTILLVEIPSPPASAPPTLSACVIHTRPHEEGSIFTGCILAEQLSDAELAALLG
jgi:hypothetical protein